MGQRPRRRQIPSLQPQSHHSLLHTPALPHPMPLPIQRRLPNQTRVRRLRRSGIRRTRLPQKTTPPQLATEHRPHEPRNRPTQHPQGNQPRNRKRYRKHARRQIQCRKRHHLCAIQRRLRFLLQSENPQRNIHETHSGRMENRTRRTHHLIPRQRTSTSLPSHQVIP